jgi:hypothetical protein
MVRAFSTLQIHENHASRRAVSSAASIARELCLAKRLSPSPPRPKDWTTRIDVSISCVVDARSPSLARWRLEATLMRLAK